MTLSLCAVPLYSKVRDYVIPFFQPSLSWPRFQRRNPGVGQCCTHASLSGAGLRVPSEGRQAGLGPGHRDTLLQLSPGLLGPGRGIGKSPDPPGRHPRVWMDRLPLQCSLGRLVTFSSPRYYLKVLPEAMAVGLGAGSGIRALGYDLGRALGKSLSLLGFGLPTYQ